jgi:hypothetical protein
MIELARRRMMMGGSAKPYDAEVEYIENDGQCIIDSKVNSNSNLTIEAKFYMPRRTDGYVTWLYGGRNLNNTIQMQGLIIQSHNTSVTSQVRYYTSAQCPRNYQGIIRILQNRNIFLELEHNDVVTLTNTSFSIDGSIFIFGFNTMAGAITYNNTHAGTRLYYWRVSNGSTVLQDLIPVRKGNRGLMYDRVTGQIFDRIDDSLDAHFIPGPDKTA